MEIQHHNLKNNATVSSEPAQTPKLYVRTTRTQTQNNNKCGKQSAAGGWPAGSTRPAGAGTGTGNYFNYYQILRPQAGRTGQGPCGLRDRPWKKNVNAHPIPKVHTQVETLM